MNKWSVLSLTMWCSFGSLAAEEIDIDKYGSKHNPASMRYYVEHYQKSDSPQYQALMIGVRVAAYTADLYTTRLDARNQRIDYCLPMTDTINRESLDNWRTKDLMTIIDKRLKRDPNLKKYGKAGIGVDIGSYLVAALKEQYPCPVQKQF